MSHKSPKLPIPVSKSHQAEDSYPVDVTIDLVDPEDAYDPVVRVGFCVRTDELGEVVAQLYRALHATR